MLYYVFTPCFAMFYDALLRFIPFRFICILYLYVELSECTLGGGFRVTQKANFYAFNMNNKVLV